MSCRVGKALATALAVALFVTLGLVHAGRVNVDYGRHDQDSYLAYAISQNESNWTALGSRRQMPIYPMFLALFYERNITLEEYFVRAKRVNIGLGLCVSLGLYLGLGRLLPRREARNVALVTIFFVLAFRAPYVQAEVLSYASIFALFLLQCAMWKRPSVALAVAVGAATTFAFLVKGTALLGLYVFSACFVMREIVRVLRERAWATALKHFALCALAVGTFAALVFPYAKNSKTYFGGYLHDMNTRYVVWCDSWEHFQKLNLKWTSNEQWLAAPPNEVPSMKNYLATHSLGDMVVRELRGLAEVIGNCLVSHGYAPFFLLLATFCVALVVQNRTLRAEVFRARDLDWVGWFAIPYLAIHLLSFGFYGPVGAGNRFSLTMFLPGMYAMTRAFAGTARPEHRVRVGSLELDWAGFQTAFLVLLVIQIATYFPAAMVTHYSGG